MTKAEELSILDETIRKLGANSYLRPWLREVRGEVEGMVKSDIFPTEITISRTHEHCLQRMANADTYCRKVGEDARKAADRIIAEANERSSAVRAHAKKRLEEAMRTISL